MLVEPTASMTICLMNEPTEVPPPLAIKLAPVKTTTRTPLFGSWSLKTETVELGGHQRSAMFRQSLRAAARARRSLRFPLSTSTTSFTSIQSPPLRIRRRRPAELQNPGRLFPAVPSRLLCSSRICRFHCFEPFVRFFLRSLKECNNGGLYLYDDFAPDSPRILGIALIQWSINK